MVVFLNLKHARNHLVEHGLVYTLQRYKKHARDLVVSGNIHSYTVVGKVLVTLIRTIQRHEQLRPYVEFSGFNSTQEWFDTAKKLYKPNRNPLFLYKNELIPKRNWHLDKGIVKT